MPEKSDKDKYDLLDAYLHEELSPAQKREFECLLKADPELDATVRLLRELRSEMTEIDWAKARSSAHSILERLLEDYHDSGNGSDSSRGVVVFDSRYLPLPDGVRPDLPDTRRIKYQVGENFLELTLYPVTSKSFEIIGMLTGQDRGVILRIILKGKNARLEECGNEFQLFRFSRVPCGRYSLRIAKEKELKAKIDIEL